MRRVFVMDFGLARSIGAGGTLTAEGQLLGTPAYMSPEQAEGAQVGSASDIYSIGATLYSLVTKRAPFEAHTPIQILKMGSEGSVTPPSEINSEIDDNLQSIILKSMRTRPEERCGSRSGGALPPRSSTASARRSPVWSVRSGRASRPDCLATRGRDRLKSGGTRDTEGTAFNSVPRSLT